MCGVCRDYEKHLKELDKKFNDPTTVQKGEEGSEVTSSDVSGPGIVVKDTPLCLCVSECDGCSCGDESCHQPVRQ